MQSNNQAVQSSYDPRWFIWTIVFLVTAGVGLTVIISTTSANDSSQVSTSLVVHHNKKAAQ